MPRESRVPGASFADYELSDRGETPQTSIDTKV